MLSFMKKVLSTGVALVIMTIASGRSHAADTPEASAAAREIDALLAQDWKQHSLQGNAPASDETFVRRVYLDLVGRIPTYEETVDFLNSADSGKRAMLIDRLLASEGFVLHQFNFLADLLRAQSKGNYHR